jgi:CheY-like chemotaxis protein
MKKIKDFSTWMLNESAGQQKWLVIQNEDFDTPGTYTLGTANFKYHVAVAKSGEEAVKIINAKLKSMDNELPGLDGEIDDNDRTLLTAVSKIDGNGYFVVLANGEDRDIEDIKVYTMTVSSEAEALKKGMEEYEEEYETDLDKNSDIVEVIKA